MSSVCGLFSLVFVHLEFFALSLHLSKDMRIEKRNE